MGREILIKEEDISEKQISEMEQRISYIFCIIQGASKKVLQFLMTQEPIYNKNFCFNEQKWLI